MKLDKLAFANIISYLSKAIERDGQLTFAAIVQLDEMIDVQVEQPVGITAEQLATLLQQLSKPGFSKIEAIKR